MQVEGLIHQISDTQVVSDNFKKRNFVLKTEYSTPYPQFVEFQMTQDKCNKLDQFNTGDLVSIQFNLRGREWNGNNGVRYFNTLEAWQISLQAKATQEQQSGGGSAKTDDDSLPF